MDREELILETSVDTLMLRCQDLKQSIAAFIIKLETEFDMMNWQSFLDNFALISGQINNMMKVIKNERTPSYKNRIVLPLLLSPDQDDDLLKLTEGRVPAFNHNMCPDYLRTKPIPEVEANEKKITDKMNKIPTDNTTKLINNSNKIVNKLLETIKNHRDSWGTDSLQTITSVNQTSFQADTHTMISACSSGNGIIEPLEPIAKSTPATTVSQTQTQSTLRTGKAPGIKTNIVKSSSNTKSTKQNF